MKSVDFQVSIDAQPLTFTAPPILKDGVWLVPVATFRGTTRIESRISRRCGDGRSLRRGRIRTLCTTSPSR